MEIYQILFLPIDWFMLDKTFNQNVSTYFLNKKLIHVKKRFVYVLYYFAIHKAADKNSSQTHSPQRNKKVMLTTAAYSKVFTPVRLYGQQYNIKQWNFDNIKKETLMKFQEKTCKKLIQIDHKFLIIHLMWILITGGPGYGKTNALTR